MTEAIELQDPAMAAAFLRSFPKATRKKGEDYFNRGAVQAIRCEEPGVAYEADVKGGDLYTTRVYYDEEAGWDADCSCPIEFECKHAYALMKALLTANNQEVVQRLSSTARKTPAPRTDVPAVRPDIPGSALAEALAATLKRPLAPREQSLVKQLHSIFHQSTETHSITGSELQSLGFGMGLTLWSHFRIAPAAPQNDHEFWLYLAHFLKGRGVALPEFLRPVSDLTPIEAPLRRWQRAQEVEQWRAALRDGRWDDTPTSAGMADLRLRFAEASAVLEWRPAGAADFTAMKSSVWNRLSEPYRRDDSIEFQPMAALLWALVARRQIYGSGPTLNYAEPGAREILAGVLRQPLLADRTVTAEGQPLLRPDTPLRWVVAPPNDDADDYCLSLRQADGSALPPLRFSVSGRPSILVSRDTVFLGPPFEGPVAAPGGETRIPAPVVETRSGIGFLQHLGADLPPRLAERIRRVPLQLKVRCELSLLYAGSDTENCWISLLAGSADGAVAESFGPTAWSNTAGNGASGGGRKAERDLVFYERTALAGGVTLLDPLKAKWDYGRRCWYLRVTKKFPELFVPWLKSLPPHVAVELDGDLKSFLNGPVAGEVRLDVEEAGIDWFDLRVVLNVTDTELTQEELKLLLNAKGRWVRLGAKGWRRLEFKLTEDEDQKLAKLGLNPHELSAEPQRLHALQLADAAAKGFMPDDKFEQVQRRARELQARVTPEVPAAIKAGLRPYQREGFHFLAYLAANRFGGILADDMGLGKTLQTLTWLAWLRGGATGPDGAFPGAVLPALVVCPKSVMDNWRAEAERFVPGLGVRIWVGNEAHSLPSLADSAALHVINYAQLRLIGDALARTDFLAVILDEGQYIKNPSSVTAQIARRLRATHRLVLSGTPIENRLLDLWSLMSFAMPGALGSRTQFTRLFDAKSDPFARQRLASRVRPFLLRRTKTQVAKDLPDRIEEDLFCEIEGEQKSLYRAELKRAQQILLKLSTQTQLNQERFHLLTSLLRLRQICCDPRLVNPGSKAASAKVEALLEQLEPLMEEGHKVLVFSQFVEMLDILKAAIAERGWPQFYLSGQTENRGDLVNEFQSQEGAAVFLISLKAGGFGLNLTAASYVVLFDPWWNPAVEHQAIDRTHRIGQTQKVIAYRLLIKDSIEEKIRALQKTKKALADDVLGEEKFSQSLSLDDLRFLFAD